MSRLAVLIAAILLSACTQNPPAKEAAGAWGKSAANSAANSATDAAKNKAVATAKDAATNVADPSLLTFSTQSVKLDDQAQAQVKLLLAQAATAKSITITGYCNRKEIGNAKAAALARANNTKKELVTLGVSAKKIKVKYVTDEPRHAAKIDFPA
ncbi:hypothetical protein BJP62_05345 [Jeongeupia sp. USM3]|nr:hypothetical protein BJP62_05345 [Jeongeupia sp. USM3]